MAVSFSGNAKAEICRSFPQKPCCAVAQCYGILLFCNSFSAESIRIVTESREFAVLLPKLFQKAFGFSFDYVQERETGAKLVFTITDLDKISLIMDAFGFASSDTVSLNINLPVLEDECCRAAFFRGAFLAGGSVTDPTKGYHMEITTTHQRVAREAFTLLQEMLGFYPKTAARGGNQILYLKNSDQISDVLTYLSAPVAAMGIMEAKLEKEISKKVNRRCNCDDANTSKVVEAAQEQLSAIRTIKKYLGLEQLHPKLKQTAEVRLENPEASLSELAAMMDPPISKPAMNNRMKRLVQIAKEINR